MFWIGTGKYPAVVTVWAIEDKETYAQVRMSTSSKNKDGTYTSSNWSFIHFIGKAYNAELLAMLPSKTNPIRLEVKGGKKIKNSNGDVIGNEMNIVSVKNKTAMPWRTAKLDIIFGEGIDVVADIFDIGVTKKIISKSGNTFNFEKETFGVGREKSIIFLKEHKVILDKIKKELNKLDN